MRRRIAGISPTRHRGSGEGAAPGPARGRAPGSIRRFAGVTNGSPTIFYTIAMLPGSYFLGNLTETFTYTSELLAILTLSGALWAIALSALVGRLRRSVRARWVTAGSIIVAGTTLAMLVGMVGISGTGPYNGATGLIFLAQIPGMALLTAMSYEPLMYDGEFVNGLIRPGPMALTHFAAGEHAAGRGVRPRGAVHVAMESACRCRHAALSRTADAAQIVARGARIVIAPHPRNDDSGPRHRGGAESGFTLYPPKHAGFEVSEGHPGAGAGAGAVLHPSRGGEGGAARPVQPRAGAAARDGRGDLCS